MRGLTVYVCARCGLVQSLPRDARAPDRLVRLSHGAAWGNVRYGKGFRSPAALALTRAHLNLERPLKALDVGSSRGAFTGALLGAAPTAHVTAVEPDERVADSCSDLERVTLVRARIEDTAFPDGSFDLVHSSHTLEHLADPAAALAAHRRALTSRGVLVLETPNLAVIESPDIVEEFFIDKHLFHFSATTLAALLGASGFQITDGPDPADLLNLSVAARGGPIEPAAVNAAEAERARSAISVYAVMRRANALALTEVAAALTAVAPRRVALWGAGSLFDALVVAGKLDPAVLAVLVDAHLGKYVSERHGVAVEPPDALAAADPGVVLVMSRAFAAEIAAEARRRTPQAVIVLYSELLAAARRGDASAAIPA
jgi:SAM-dependent methyltransferase